MKVRKTKIEDIPTLLTIFDYGRQLQYSLGNYYQWNQNYPNEDVLRQDIQSDISYVCVSTQDNKEEIIGTFALQGGSNPIFDLSDPDQWINQDEYITIQRMCSNGKEKGTGKKMMTWIQENCSNVRIYTHEANKLMLKLCDKTGFVNCGEFFIPDKTKRIGFQYSK